MDIIDRLQEVTEIASRGLDHFFVTVSAEEFHKTAAEKNHPVIVFLAGYFA
jgi:hypothetical protein